MLLSTVSSGTNISISQTAVPGETLTSQFLLGASFTTGGGPSGSSANSTGRLNITVDNPTSYALSGSMTMNSTNGTGAVHLYLRHQPPGPFIYQNFNTSGGLITMEETIEFSENNNTGLLLPNVNYQLEWNWSVNRAFGRDPISGSGTFQLTLVEDISVVLGDIDGDGFVGAGDLDLILANWGATGTPADADGSGTVGQGDLDIVTGNWGGGSPPETVVPEPGSLAALGLCSLLVMRRRR
ncbi:PEP-CTERM sorting domain-containing protein [Phycisphaeraceae bacterium D3-23]